MQDLSDIKRKTFLIFHELKVEYCTLHYCAIEGSKADIYLYRNVKDHCFKCRRRLQKDIIPQKSICTAQFLNFGVKTPLGVISYVGRVIGEF